MENQTTTTASKDPILDIPEISTYVEELLKNAGLELPAEEKEQYKQKLEVEVQRRLGIVAMNLLNEESMDEYVDLLNNQGDEIEPSAIQEFFQAKIPSFDAEMKSALDGFTHEFLENVNKLNEV